MTKGLVTDYVSLFDMRINDLDKLIETPSIIKQQALATLYKLSKSSNLYATDKKTIENGIQGLNNIQEGSVRNNYRIIYAQLCVLATSVLEALLKEYFINAIGNISNLNPTNDRLDKIRITAADLVNHKLKYTLEFPKLILEREKNEFQNLKKLKDLFKDYLDKKITLSDEDEKKIIFYLECRHVIVHKGSVVDRDFIRNVTIYKNANLKRYSHTDRIELIESDWDSIKFSYRKLIENTTRRVN